MVNRLYDDDWAEYDAMRNEVKEKDAIFFACTETWEVNYFKEKIAQKNPEINKKIITKVIQLCCRELMIPHPRSTFSYCVTGKLSNV